MKYEKETVDKNILEIILKISNEKVDKVSQVCERYGEGEDDVRYYDVYEVDTPSGSKILKKTSQREVCNYERYLRDSDFAVPAYYGKYEEGENIWILIENIHGNDLRDMTDAAALSAADSLAHIQNAYWMKKTDERFDIYIERINKRYNYIKDEPVIGEAYKLFLERQSTCPLTLSNGDFMEFNTISHNERVYVIDWGFGGIMPYSLDIARFIAHATIDRATFPFYMSDEQKKLFINRVYDKLETKPEFSQYIYDIKLAVLNEYVEFIEAEEDDDKWYYEHALKLAGEILSSIN